MSEFSFNTKGLDALIATLKGRPPRARIGVLSSKNIRRESDLSQAKKVARKAKKHGNFFEQASAEGNVRRSSAGETNAKIGLKHEFGIGVPMRSFLRIPIADNFQQYLENAGAFDSDAFKKVIAKKSLTLYVKRMGIVGETIVSDAFATGGFGKWKESQMKDKKVKQTLVETQQLRNSISSEVIE
jgi:hypothetical protein